MATNSMEITNMRERARMEREDRDRRIAYYRARNQGVLDAMNEREPNELQQLYQIRPQAVQQQQPQSNENTLTRIGNTVANLHVSPLLGTVDAVEGIWDTVLSAVGMVGGIFDSGFKDTMKRWIEHDFTNRFLRNPTEAMVDDSYLRDNEVGRIADQVMEGVGGMLPNILLYYFLGPAAALGSVAASSGGQGQEQAYQEGADFYEGVGAGVANAAVEVATEKLMGGLDAKVFGKGVLDGAAKSIGKEVGEQGVKRVAKGMASEALEEGAAELASPLIRSIYKGSEAFEEYKDPSFYGRVGESALVGGLTGTAIGAGTGNVGARADIQSSMESVEKLEKMRGDLFADDRLNNQTQTAINQSVQKNLSNVEKTLQKVSPEKREKLMQQYRLTSLFSEDGKIRPEIVQSLSTSENAQSVANGAQEGVVAVDQRYASPNLWENQERVQKELSEISNDLREQTGNPEIPDVKQFTGELGEAASTAYRQLKRAVNTISERTQTGLNFVLVEPSEYFSGVLPSGSNTVYITADTLENGTWAKQLVHEVMHFAEDSEAYNRLIGFLAEDLESFERIITELTGEGNGYGFTKELLASLTDKLMNGEELTAAERTLQNELNAHLAAELLGNEQTINRLAQKDASLAKRILEKIKGLIEAFRTLGNKEARAQYKRLKKAEALFEAAIENAGENYVKSQIEKAQGEMEQERERTSYSLRIKHSNGSVEELEDARALTEDQAVSYLEQAKEGKIQGHSYIPVRKNTPQVIIDTLEQVNEHVSNNSLVMQVRKAQQAMSTENPGDRSKKHGNNIRRHGLTPRQIVEIINNLDNPSMAIYQTNRTDKNGKELPNNVAFFVEYNNNGAEGVAVIEFDSAIDKEYIGTENGDTAFHTVVTIFEPDTARDGLPFDYAEELLSNPNNIELEIRRRPSARSATREKHPNTSSKSPSSKVIIARDSLVVNIQNKNKSKFSRKSPVSVGAEDLFPAADEELESRKKNRGENAQDADPKIPASQRNFADEPTGRAAQTAANRNQAKVYTRQDASEIVGEVLADRMYFGEVYGTLRGKSRQEVIDALWTGLNKAQEGERAGVALNIADYILESAIVEETVENPANEDLRERLAVLKGYLRKFDLSSMRAEIKHLFDDKAKRIYSRWGARKGTNGMTPDMVVDELAERGIQITATHPADILAEIESMYQTALDELNRQKKALLKETLKVEERKELKQKIAKDILDNAYKKGSSSKLADIANDYAKQVKALKGTLAETKGRDKLVNSVLERLDKIRKLKLGTYNSVSEFNDPLFRGSIEALAKIEYRGNLSEGAVRPEFEKLSKWYTEKNKLLQDDGFFQEDVYNMISDIANGEGMLNKNDLKNMINVLNHMIKIVETHNKIYRNGRYVETEPIAKQYIKTIERNKKIRVPIMDRLMRGHLTKDGKLFSYVQSFADPYSLMRYTDRYAPDGFYTSVFEELERGAVGVSVTENMLREAYEKFFKDHKDYAKRLVEDKIDYLGRGKIPRNVAITLYMTTKREQAHKAFAKSGFKLYVPGESEPIVFGGADVKASTPAEYAAAAKLVREQIAAELTNEDLEFVKIIEKIFNEDCAELKVNTDMERLGYTNVQIGGYYFPIYRANVAKNIDTESFYEAMDRVSNLSINKNLVEGASAALNIVPVDKIFDRHVHQVSLYANLWSAVDNYNRLFNMNVSDDPNKVVSINAVTGDVYSKQANEYLKNLLADVQGKKVDTKTPIYNYTVAALRRTYATYQLGANPKTWLSQLSSFFAATNILDVDSIIKGFGVKGTFEKGNDLVDQYCPLAKVRNEENTAVMAQSVLEKTTGKIGEVLTKPIGWTDRMVIRSLFGACQVQVEKNGGAKIGTEENLKAAGELLERVILKTQQNALATERSAAMRSNDELLRGLTMFSADSMKVFGRFLDASGEVLTLRQWMKMSDLDTNERAELQRRMQDAKRRLGRSAAALTTGAVFAMLIGWMFSAFYRRNKDKEPKELAWELTFDTFGNMIGGLPVIRDIYGLFTDGFEIENSFISQINDMADAIKGGFGVVSDAIGGKEVTSQQWASNVRKILYGMGQISGIPVRNLYNVTSGVIGLVSPNTGYRIDNVFAPQNYTKDLRAAIEAGDDKKVGMIAGLMTDQKMNGQSDAVRKVLKGLVEEEYDVLPRTLGDTITYEGEDFELTKAQKSRFRKLYSAADAAVERLIKLAAFQKASKEDQARAIRIIYDTYYALAQDDLLGLDSERKSVLFAEALDIEKLALIIATARNIKGDVGRDGKTISGSRKQKVTDYVSSLNLKAVEKYMIMGYLGYTNTHGREQVRAHINGLNLSNKEKSQLLEYSGYPA